MQDARTAREAREAHGKAVKDVARPLPATGRQEANGFAEHLKQHGRHGGKRRGLPAAAPHGGIFYWHRSRHRTCSGAVHMRQASHERAGHDCR